MTIKNLVTHSGLFHADDVFAAIILTTLFPDAKIQRTRDEDYINTLDETSIVFDVGMIYNADLNRYDHHQSNRALREEQVENLDIPYSSLGLVWKHFGKEYLKTVFNVSEQDCHSIHTGVDRRFIIKIDMGDNGVVPPSEAGLNHPLSITRLIEILAPDFDNRTDETEMDSFLQALTVAKPIFEAKVRSLIAAKRSDKMARQAVQNRKNPKWVELPQGMPYLNALRAEKADDVLYVVMPGKTDKEWQLSAVRQSSGPLGCKKPLPEKWAGLRGKDLQKVTQTQDAVFCHLGRFMAVAESRESIIQLVNLALEDE
jgi:uncharacterized UPF0160 family protein